MHWVKDELDRQKKGTEHEKPVSSLFSLLGNVIWSCFLCSFRKATRRKTQGKLEKILPKTDKTFRKNISTLFHRRSCLNAKSSNWRRVCNRKLVFAIASVLFFVANIVKWRRKSTKECKSSSFPEELCCSAVLASFLIHPSELHLNTFFVATAAGLSTKNLSWGDRRWTPSWKWTSCARASSELQTSSLLLHIQFTFVKDALIGAITLLALRGSQRSAVLKKSWLVQAFADSIALTMPVACKASLEAMLASDVFTSCAAISFPLRAFTLQCHSKSLGDCFLSNCASFWCKNVA